MKYNLIIICCLILETGCAKREQSPTSSENPQNNDTIQYVVKPQHDIPWPSLAQTAWPMALHDAQCTGRSSFVGPSTGKVKYEIPMSGYSTDAVVASDSILYVITDSSLCSITITGNYLWKISLGRYPPEENTPLIDSRGIIYVGVYDGVSTYRGDGTLYWHTKLDEGVTLKSCALGLDGTLYCVSRNATLYAISQSGDILWQIKAPIGEFNWNSDNTISFAPDGSQFYVGGSTSQQSLYTISTAGVILRVDSLGGRQMGAISVDNDGNVFCNAGGLVSISPSGVVRWRLAYPVYWNIVIDPYGNIACLSDSLCLIDNNGQKRWTVPVHTVDNITHIVCDSKGTIYIESSDDLRNYDVQAVSNKGVVLWTLTLPSYVKEAGTSLTKDGYLLYPNSGYFPDSKIMYVIE